MKLSKHSFLILITAIHILCATRAPSSELPRDGNLRDACRKLVAGLYLSTFDHEKKSIQYQTLLELKTKELRKHLVIVKQQLNDYNKQLANTPYDLNLQYERDGIADKIKITQATIIENNHLASKAKVDALRSKELLEHLRKRIVKVFAIEDLPGKKGPYNFRLSYTHKCPRYRTSCPLPKESAKNLVDIFTRFRLPLACKRYSTFLNQ